MSKRMRRTCTTYEQRPDHRQWFWLAARACIAVIKILPWLSRATDDHGLDL